jgi:putative addiction module killer protein
MAETKPRELKDFENLNGKRPFREWFGHLIESDPASAVKVGKYLERLKQGNFSNAKLLPGCGGVWELVMDFGPGWRVYFALAGAEIILLLWGGNKRGQQKDIQAAMEYWTEFKQRNRGKK